MDHQCYTRKEVVTKRERHNCCVPQCSEVLSANNTLHRIPKEPERRKKWAVAIRSGKDLTQTMRVCGKHFTDDDYLSTGRRRTFLKKFAVPSQNLPTRPHDRVETSPVKRRKAARADRAKKRCLMACVDHQANPEEAADPEDAPDLPEDPGQEEDREWEDIPEIEEDDVPKFKSVGVQVGCYDETFVKSILSSDGKLYASTGIYNRELLEAMTNAFDKIAPENPQKKFMMKTRDRIILTMMKIKLAVSFASLAAFFEISLQNASNYFNDTVKGLALIMNCVVEWPPKELILKNMPTCFQDFKNTRVVLDCFETFVEKPNCNRCRVRLYSQYKRGYTIKLLLCCAPSGLIIKVSEAFGGRASDKFITKKSGIYDLCDFGDGIMVDKGFAIEEDCQENFLTMIRPPFLKKRNKFTRAEAVQCAKIARARVHIERTIKRVRDFAILKNKLPWSMMPHIDDVLLIVCGLINLGTPILAPDKFGP